MVYDCIRAKSINKICDAQEVCLTLTNTTLLSQTKNMKTVIINALQEGKHEVVAEYKTNKNHDVKCSLQDVTRNVTYHSNTLKYSTQQHKGCFRACIRKATIIIHLRIHHKRAYYHTANI